MSDYYSNMHISPDYNQIVQQATFHIGFIRDVKDPDKRGRIRVEVPSLWTDKEQCWSGWIDRCALPVGSSYRDGDHGVFWPPIPGEKVLVGFIAGDSFAPFCIPGPTWQIDPGDDQEVVPQDAKQIGKKYGKRAITKVRGFKSEAGHTLWMDDNGTAESMMLVDWTGAGIFWDAPGQESDPQEQDNKPSYFRSAERREHRTTAAGTSKSPGQLVKTGQAVLGVMDLNGQGVWCVAEDGDGRVVIQSAKGLGQEGPSIVLDSKNQQILLTAGETQVIVDGKMGMIKHTRDIIKESAFTPVCNLVSGVIDRFKSTFSKYTCDCAEDQGQGKPRGTITA